MAGDLDRTDRPDVDDDHRLLGAQAMNPHPHRRAEQMRWYGVLAAVEGHHRSLGSHGPGDPERDGVRDHRHRMQPGLFLGEHVGRGAAGDPVDPAVDVITELLTRHLELGERVVGVEQVGVLGDQVGLGDLDRRLAATLGSGVDRLTRVDGHRVVAGERNHGRVADRDPSDVLGGDGLLVIGQQVRRRPTHAAQRHVQGGHHTRCSLVPDRQHHPEP